MLFQDAIFLPCRSFCDDCNHMVAAVCIVIYYRVNFQYIDLQYSVDKIYLANII